MVGSTKGNGNTDKLKVKGSFCMPTEMSTKACGTITRAMDTESMSMSKALGTKVNGRMISNMEKELKLGMKDQDMKVVILMEERKVMVSTGGLMDPSTKETGLTTRSTDWESIYGKTGGSITVNGKIMIWKAMVFTSGLMEGDLRDNIMTIRKKVMVFITGLMVENMKVGGTRESNMVLALISILQKER